MDRTKTLPFRSGHTCHPYWATFGQAKIHVDWQEKMPNGQTKPLMACFIICIASSCVLLKLGLNQSSKIWWWKLSFCKTRRQLVAFEGSDIYSQFSALACLFGIDNFRMLVQMISHWVAQMGSWNFMPSNLLLKTLSIVRDFNEEPFFNELLEQIDANRIFLAMAP